MCFLISGGMAFPSNSNVVIRSFEKDEHLLWTSIGQPESPFKRVKGSPFSQNYVTHIKYIRKL